MAHFYRLIFLALVCAFLFVSRPVFAVVGNPISIFNWWGFWSDPTEFKRLCEQMYKGGNWATCTAASSADASGKVTLMCTNPPWSYEQTTQCSGTITGWNNRPANSTYSGGLYFSCVSGFAEVNGSCVAIPPPPPPRLTAAEAVALVNAMGGMVVAGTALSLEMCVGGTIVRGEMSAVYPEFGNAIWGPYTSTGQACTVGSGAGVAAPGTMPRAADAVDSTSCAALGGQFGKVNGVAVCVPRSDDPSNVAAIVQPLPESQTTADGTVIAKVNTTSCDSSTCTTTTTTTTTPPGGTATTSTATATAAQDDFCRQNSHLPMCKDARYFAQGCAAPPACDGDAIQCGIARQTWATSCALDPSETAETAAGRAAARVVGDQSATLEGNRSISISSSSYSQDPVFSSSGMADVTVTVSGQQITIPFSNVNYILEMLGSIGVAVCFLAAMKITFGGQIA